MSNSSEPTSIAVFSGNRAEYGLLRHLINAIEVEPSLRLQLIISGSHLSNRNGNTIDEIIEDGHSASALIQLSIDEHPKPSMASLTAEALSAVSRELERLNPSLVILLGDRYETFAAAAAAHLTRIPIVHLHGGERTTGAIDDRLRHAITQLSTWHFTAAEPYRQRVIAMGQPPDRVINIGPMVLDALHLDEPVTKNGFEESTGYRFGEKNLLVTYHPETLLPDNGVWGFKELLHALKLNPCNILFTQPNCEDGSDELLRLLQEFVGANGHRSWFIPSLGQKRYLAALRLFDAVAGNSSSGIIEAPLLGVPVLNIGDRQAGRVQKGYVYDTSHDGGQIRLGLKKVLTTKRGAIGTCMAVAKPTEFILNWLRGGDWR